jgi:hypothetical protein
MYNHKDIQECYDLTGVNPLILNTSEFNIEVLKTLNPKVFQYMVWKLRKKDNSNLQMSDVTEYDFEEIRKAVRDFFLKE